MSADIVGNQSQFIETWQNNSDYFKSLQVMAGLSRLFSESDVPYLDYRVVENMFCRFYAALNDARSCTAYDARLGHLGIGIKTFILKNGTSIEKIAEFNKLRPELSGLQGRDLAVRLGEFRNSRMEFADNTYSVSSSQYHIVGRCRGCLRIFNTAYERVDVDKIHNVRSSQSGITFDDERNEYIFNVSKSVLQKRFCTPQHYKDVPVTIIDDPLEYIFSLIPAEKSGIVAPLTVLPALKKGVDYVILPLYSSRGKIKEVPPKSGLNQWNAGGRARDDNEVYIPIPIEIRRKYPNFFPDRDTNFVLELPDGKRLQAKVCQDGGKALMSNPNSDLGEWLLRKVLKKRPGELVTMSDLLRIGIDSVMITKKQNTNEGMSVFGISFFDTPESYDDFTQK